MLEKHEPKKPYSARRMSRNGSVTNTELDIPSQHSEEYIEKINSPREDRVEQPNLFEDEKTILKDHRESYQAFNPKQFDI